ALGNTLEAVTATYFLKKYRKNNFISISNLFVLFFLSIPVGVILSATFGTGSLVISRIVPLKLAGVVFKFWLLGDAMGIIIFTPLILSWYRWLKLQDNKGDFATNLEKV